MKINEILLSALFKKGIIAELNNIETEVLIPDTKIIAKIKIENLTLKFESSAE